MSYQTEREEFIVAMGKEGLPLDVTRRVLRYANTIQRLAVAVCNGDYPADNGERDVKACPVCERLWVPSSIKTMGCPECRATLALDKAVTPLGFSAKVDGDPRGYCVHLRKDKREWGVPSRRY